MKNYHAQELISKYRRGEATPEECALVEEWFANNLAANPYIPSQEQIAEADLRITENVMKHVYASPDKNKTVLLWQRIAVAVSILLFLWIGGYFLFHQPTATNIVQTPTHIIPGSNKAILTLANGKQIILTSARNGQLAMESNTEIDKTSDGQVTYKANQSGKNGAVNYNTMTTPRGGQYTLTLADGTIAVLDAASSIRYPVAFTGSERKVEITGQVYFEVAHNQAKPFRVSSHNQTVEVLGTHFNINAYTDETATKTTLLQGSVKVIQAGTGETNIIKPGQQCLLSDRLFTVSNVKTEDAVAWKNGYFMFNNEPLEIVMRKISRWYDVDIEYQDNDLKNENTYGSLSKFSNVTKVLNLLQMTGAVKFHITGNKITVSKN